jgi:hypothetical protein
MAKAVARSVPDMQKWPHNPESNFVDAWPRWRDVYDWDLPVSKLRQVDSKACAELCELNLFEKLTPALQQAVRAFAEGRSYDNGETQDLILTPERLTSLAEQSNKVEVARASIDAHALFQLAATAIATGDLTGTPLCAKEKIDLIKWLGSRVVPEAKSQDMAEVVQRVDRGRRKASEFSSEDLKTLTRQELLDLLE